MESVPLSHLIRPFMNLTIIEHKVGGGVGLKRYEVYPNLILKMRFLKRIKLEIIDIVISFSPNRMRNPI